MDDNQIPTTPVEPEADPMMAPEMPAEAAPESEESAA